MSNFEVGDWIVCKGETTPYQIKTQTVANAYNSTTIPQAIMWQPKADDWCWYGFELVQVIDVQPDHIKICRQKSPTYEEISQECLKPFIGQIPEIVYRDIHYDDDK